MSVCPNAPPAMNSNITDPFICADSQTIVISKRFSDPWTNLCPLRSSNVLSENAWDRGSLFYVLHLEFKYRFTIINLKHTGSPSVHWHKTRHLREGGWEGMLIGLLTPSKYFHIHYPFTPPEYSRWLLSFCITGKLGEFMNVPRSQN